MGNIETKKKNEPWYYLVKRMTWDMCESLEGNKIFVSRDGQWYILGEKNGKPVVLLSNCENTDKWYRVVPETDTRSFQRAH